MLSAKQRSRLSALSQERPCLASVGRAGATEAFAARVDELLRQHELVKLRLAGDDAASRSELAAELAARSGAELVRVIGKVAVLYRANPALGDAGIALDV